MATEEKHRHGEMALRVLYSLPARHEMNFYREMRRRCMAPRHYIWVCLFLLAFLSGDGGLNARAQTSPVAGSAKVNRHPNMDAPGNDAPWVRGITSVEQCESLCLADSACAGYTYNINKSTCIPKTIIGPLFPTREAAITGIVDRRSGGPAAQNRAIMVEGKPSFDCRQARDDAERMICASPSLGRLDVQLAELYRARVAQLQSSGGDDERGRQRDWIGVRKKCGANTSCLEQAYKKRIAELGGQALAATAPPSQSPPPAQQAPDQKPQPEAEARREGPIGTVQQLPNPIRLIGQADQPCDVASATLTPLRKNLSVSGPDGLNAQAEELRSFVWKTSGAPPLGPAYVVLAADAPVRVQGTGFYALTPQAKAPFRIKQFIDHTRVIVPLHVKGAPQSGEIKIRPLIAGPLKLSAAIVGYTQCGENPDPAPVEFDLTVEPGAPEIVIADRFELAKPDQIIASPDGKRRVEIYGPRYNVKGSDSVIHPGFQRRFRLIDETSGAQLADELGAEPRFSPSGRFVIAWVENDYSIRDTVDGKYIGRTNEGNDIAWDDRDSFIVAGTYLAYGIIPIENALVENSANNGFTALGCSHITISIKDVSFKLDLENNIAVASCDMAEAPSALSLTIPQTEEESQQSYDEHQSGKIPELLGSFLVSPFTRPTRWDMIDGLKFTHHVDYTKVGGGWEGIATEIAPFVASPIVMKEPNAYWSVNKAPLDVANRAIGAMNLPESTRHLKIEQRLRDFGVEPDHGELMVGVISSKFLKSAKSKPKVFNFVKDQAINVELFEHDTGECVYQSLGNGRGKLLVEGWNKLPESDELLGEINAKDFQITVINTTCSHGAGGQVMSPHAYLHDSRRLGQLLDLRAEFPDEEGGDNGNKCSDGNFFGCGFEAELFFNRYLVVWSQRSYAAAIYDIEERKLLHLLEGLPSPDFMQRMSLSRDLKTLAKLDTDGGFQVIALKSAQRDKQGHLRQDSTKADILLSGRIVDDEVVVWTPSGQFDSTAEGASHVAVRFPGRSGEYTLDQFHKLFHENDLLKRALAGEAFKPPVVKTFPPSIKVKPAFTTDSIAAKTEVLGDDPVDEIRVYQDGLMTNVIPVTADAKNVGVSAKRLPGARWVAFLARGPSGLYSQPVTFDAGLFPGARRRVHIVSVGIDHYDDDRIQQLHFAGSDAARFLKTLQDKVGTSVEIVSQTLLRDADASREAILAKLNETLAKAEPGDSILLFIAGHGVQATDKNYYLATSVTRVDDIENTSLRWSDLSSTLAKAHSRIAVFLDTCQSGKAGTDFFATNDASVSALIDRAPSGILIFSASKGREFSEESADHGGGVFTSAVIAALSDPKTDRNHNGAIEASELYASVKRAVVEATEGRQTPWFARNDMVGDFVPF